MQRTCSLHFFLCSINLLDGIKPFTFSRVVDAEARNTARAQQAAAKAAEEAAIRNEKNPAKQKPATKGNFEPSPAEGFGSSGEDSAVSIPAPKEPTTEVWQDTLELDSAFGSAKDQTGTAGEPLPTSRTYRRRRGLHWGQFSDLFV